MDLVRRGGSSGGGEGRVEASVAELGRVDAREKGWGWSDCRRGVWRESAGEAAPLPEWAYLVQSGHEKQDENEDVKGRDHQQEERHGCGGSLGWGVSGDGRFKRLAQGQVRCSNPGGEGG